VKLAQDVVDGFKNLIGLRQLPVGQHTVVHHVLDAVILYSSTVSSGAIQPSLEGLKMLRH